MNGHYVYACVLVLDMSVVWMYMCVCVCVCVCVYTQAIHTCPYCSALSLYIINRSFLYCDHDQCSHDNVSSLRTTVRWPKKLMSEQISAADPLKEGEGEAATRGVCVCVCM